MSDKQVSLNRIDPVIAWQHWRPDAARPWSRNWAAHLYRRAAFCPSHDEVQSALDNGLEPTVERLLRGQPNLPDLDAQIQDTLNGMASNSRSALLSEYQAVWLYRMVNTPYPLRERMTLFWHNHFATSIAKVRLGPLMQRQNGLLRKHALGSFRTLLLEISRDPAMLIWLDSNSNVKSKPNENFARELLELFGLGVGHYTERDIQEAARAFTGWHTDKGEFYFNPAQHDDGPKTVFGHTGAWDGGDIVRLVLDRPQAARFIVRKLYRHFISENLEPPDALLEPLAEQFRRADYDIGAVVGMILRSQHFFSASAYRQRIKSPVEYVIGIIRSLGGSPAPSALADTLEGMGQSLFAPPSVKGWDGGKAWLNSATMLARYNMAWTLVGGDNPNFKRKLDPAAFARKHAGADQAKQVAFLLDLFLQGEVQPAVRQKLVDFLRAAEAQNVETEISLRELAHAILVLPEYQLA